MEFSVPRRPLILAVLGLFLLAGCQRPSLEELRADALRFQQAGNNAAAIIQLKNALAIRHDDAELRYLLATMYNDTGEVLAAEKEIRQAIRFAYPKEKALPVLAQSLLLQGRFQQALDETAALADRTPAVRCLRGDAWLGLGNTIEAGKEYEAALARQPQFAAAFVGRAKLAYLAGHLDAAHDLAAKAVSLAPSAADTLMFQADLMRARGQAEQALSIYDKVITLRPAHRSAHIEKAYQLIALGRFPQAQEEIDAARKNTPGSLLVTYSKALLDYAKGEHAAALSSLQMVLRAYPEHMPSVLLAGAVNFKLGHPHQAEQHLRTYLATFPANGYARQLLAAVLLQADRAPNALEVLAPALKDGSEDLQTLALAGESYMQARDFSKASELFSQAAEFAPEHALLRTSLGLSKLGSGDQHGAIKELQQAVRLDASLPQPAIALAQTHLELGEYDRALAVLAGMEQHLPANAMAHELKGRVWLAKGQPDKARASYARALELQPSHFPAAMQLVQLDLAQRNFAHARAELTRFLEKNKHHLDAMTAMAGLADSENKPAEALQWLEQASAAHPESIPAHTRRIAKYLLMRQPERALTLARTLQVEHAGNPDLLDLLGKSQLANGDRAGALESYKKLVLALPLSAQAQMQVAALLMLMERTPEAEDYLKTALALQPDFPAAQLALAELQVRKGQHELALMAAHRLQRHHPKASAGYQLEGDILLGQGKSASALAAYAKASALAPSAELAVKSAHALRLSGRADDARKRLAQWLQSHPGDVRVQLFMAETWLADRAFANAAEQLQVLLKEHPENVTALNNLAWAYQQLGDARALEVAATAARLAPANPAVLDTHGWLLVESGALARGLELLKKANALAPSARDIRYHLAVALHHSGDNDGAREQLRLALAGNDRFPQVAQARQLAERLQTAAARN
jgi:putative PEP-CTERM system TPR-repeat lipoprotein